MIRDVLPVALPNSKTRLGVEEPVVGLTNCAMNQEHSLRRVDDPEPEVRIFPCAAARTSAIKLGSRANGVTW